MLDFVELTGSDESGRAFTEAAVEILRQLVPCDVVGYREWTGERGYYERAIAGDDLDARWKVWRHYNEVRDDDPLPGGVGVPSSAIVARPLAVRDVMAMTRFRQTAVYAAQCKPLGVRDILKLFLPPAGDICSCFVFDTSASEFNEHDKLVLQRLLPFFAQAQRNAHVRAKVLAAGARLASLTVREREILARVADGDSNEQIAATFFIGISTVRKHVEHVLEKLEVRNRAQAAAIYMTAMID